MPDFNPGLEGIVAVETEIAEPDREGGSLRYRGVDIEELVGRHPYESVWGLLVDDDLNSRMPDPEPYEPAGLTGHAPADLQAETARMAGVWGLGKLNEISDEQAREDLGRLSAQMMSIVARSARIADGKTDVVPDEVVAAGATAAEKFLLRWRGEADPRHVKAIDTYWICTAEHGFNASTFTARVVASTGADCGAALSAAVGALSGPLHGGAPAYVKPMLDEVAAHGDAEGWVRDALASGKRIMGFGHRVYRAEDPRSRILKRTAEELGSPYVEVAQDARARRARSAPGAPSRARAGDERRVLLGGRAGHRRDPAAARARDVRLLPGRRVVGPHPRAEEDRAPLQALGALRRAGGPLVRVTILADAVGRAAELSDERALADLRRSVDDELEAAARSKDYRERALAYRAIGQLRFNQKTELLRRGLEDESPAARGSALLSLELLSRTHPGVVNAVRGTLHALANEDPNPAVRRLAILALKNGSPQQDTLTLLAHIASEGDDRELKAAAASVHATLKKKAAARA